MSKFWVLVRSLFNRIFVLYGVIGMLLWFLFVNSNAMDVARLKSLNRLRPKYEQLVLMNDGKDISQKALRSYRIYFQKVTEYIPAMAQPYGLLGYCYFLQGEGGLAIQSIKKSLEINPSFFWNHFNLGMIYFLKEDYDQAVKHFKAANNVSPEATIKTIMISKAYAPAFSNKADSVKILSENLKSGYVISQKMAALSAVLVQAKDNKINTLQTQAIMRKLKLDEKDIRLRIF